MKLLDPHSACSGPRDLESLLLFLRERPPRRCTRPESYSRIALTWDLWRPRFKDASYLRITSHQIISEASGDLLWKVQARLLFLLDLGCGERLAAQAIRDVCEQKFSSITIANAKMPEWVLSVVQELGNDESSMVTCRSIDQVIDSGALAVIAAMSGSMSTSRSNRTRSKSVGTLFDDSFACLRNLTEFGPGDVIALAVATTNSIKRCPRSLKFFQHVCSDMNCPDPCTLISRDFKTWVDLYAYLADFSRPRSGLDKFWVLLDDESSIPVESKATLKKCKMLDREWLRLLLFVKVLAVGLPVRISALL